MLLAAIRAKGPCAFSLREFCQDNPTDTSHTGNNCLRKISDGIVAVICGSGVGGDKDGEAWAARFNTPKGLAVNNANNIFVADQENNKIRIVFGTDWSVSTVAGAGKRGHRDGPADQALFIRPEDGALGWDGDIFVADTMNHVIRRCSASARAQLATAVFTVTSAAPHSRAPPQDRPQRHGHHCGR